MVRPTHPRPWRRALAGTTLAVTALTMLLVLSSASATTTSCTDPATLAGSAFEIDTDANLRVDTAGCIDWLAGGAGSALRSGVITQNDQPTGSGDNSFGEGTKEDTAVPTVVAGSIPPNKSDLKVFGVYTERGAGATFLNLFWSRVQDPSGTTNMDFEFNQSSALSANGVTPVRMSGDLLITYDLSRGGTQATISKRSWNGTAWGAATPLTGAQALGTVNTSTIPTNEAGTPGGIGQHSPRTFGEASINLNAVFSPGQCGRFGSAYLKSRSSDSFSAALKDFIAPVAVNISNCTSLVTQATSSILIGGGNTISDTATLSGATASAGGTITFKLYGPFTLGSDPSGDTCNDSTNLVFTSTAQTLTGPDTNGDYTASASYTPTAVGRYQWRAFYSGDAQNVAANTPCKDANEASLVNPRSPTMTTSATASVIIGAEISDTATLSGATSDAGGTITFKLYGPFALGSDPSGDTCVDSGTGANLVFTSSAQPLTASGADYTATASHTPTAVGRYQWRAFYSGDAKNNATSTPCKDANEASVVNTQATSLATMATVGVLIGNGNTISDTATLSGATSDAGGTITFTAYGPFNPIDPATGDACIATNLAFTSTAQSLTGPDGSGNYSASASFAPSAVGRYQWVASYTGDAKNDPATTACNDLNEQSLVNPRSPTLATSATASVTFNAAISDTATLSGATSDAGGTITFKLYGPFALGSDASGDTCVDSGDGANLVATFADKPLAATATPGTFTASSGDHTPAAAGRYQWRAFYSGDAKNLATDTPCKDANEASVVNKASSDTATAQTLLPNDTATITGVGTVGGTVDFQLYGPGDATCSGTPVFEQLGVAVTSGLASTSNTSTTVTAEGTYKWVVVYSGDANHNGSTSPCGEEFFTLDNG